MPTVVLPEEVMATMRYLSKGLESQPLTEGNLPTTQAIACGVMFELAKRTYAQDGGTADELTKAVKIIADEMEARGAVVAPISRNGAVC